MILKLSQLVTKSLNNGIKGDGTTPLTGEIGGGWKKATVLGMMCLCKTVHQSQWTRQNNVARIRRVRQEVKSERAPSECSVATPIAIAVGCVREPLVHDEEPCSKD